MLLAGAVTAIDCNTAPVTFNVVDPETEPKLAVNVADPVDLPVVRPVVVSTDATELADELQVTPLAIALDVPSL